MSALAVSLGLVLLVWVCERRRGRRVESVRAALWLSPRLGLPITSVLMVAAAVLVGAALLVPSPEAAEEPSSPTAPVLVLALDVSHSMTVSDVFPDRLSAALGTALRITASAPPGPIGLVAFAGDARLIVPPTVDRRLISTQLEALAPNAVGAQGSDLSNALAVSVQALGPDDQAGAVIVLSDSEGFEESDRRSEAVEEAVRRGVPIHWITLGTQTGGAVPGQSRSAHSSANPETGSEVAAATGGVSLGGDDGLSLGTLLGRLEDRTLDTEESATPPAPDRRQTSVPLLAFMAFAVLGLETVGLGRQRWGTS